MSLQYLIDGYNLLYALPKLPEGTWEQKRDALVRKMATERPQGKNRLTVVFDSREGLGDQRRQGEIDIIYTAGETADDWIIKKVRDVPNARVLVVVTEDQGLRRMVRGTGAQTIGAKEFWQRGTPPARLAPHADDLSPQDEITEEMKKKWLT